MMDLGYDIIPAVFSGDECRDLETALSSPQLARSRAGARHLLGFEPVSKLAHDKRLRAIADAALQTDAIPFRVTLFDKTDGSNWSVVWHQDTALPLRDKFDAPGWGPWSMKAGIHYAHAPAFALEQVVALRVHLDDSLSTNGPLNVIPRTHLLGVLDDDEVSRIAAEADAVECLVPRGGVLAMRPLLIHSSPRLLAPMPRRVLHIEYASTLQLAPGIELAAA